MDLSVYPASYQLLPNNLLVCFNKKEVGVLVTTKLVKNNNKGDKVIFPEDEIDTHLSLGIF